MRKTIAFVFVLATNKGQLTAKDLTIYRLTFSLRFDIRFLYVFSIQSSSYRPNRVSFILRATELFSEAKMFRNLFQVARASVVPNLLPIDSIMAQQTRVCFL